MKNSGFTTLKPVLVWGLLLFFASSSLISQENKSRIQWKKIAGIDYYKVQVRRQPDSKLIINKIISENYLDLDLEKGEYETRTAALNRFKKPIVWSNWRRLSILQMEKPELLTSLIRRKDGQSLLEIEGKHVDHKTQVYLKGEKSGSYLLKQIGAYEKSASVLLALPSAQLAPQKYYLEMVNPQSAPARMKNVLEVKDNGELVNLFQEQNDIYDDTKTFVTDSNTSHTNTVKLEPIKDEQSIALSKYIDYIDNLASDCQSSDLPDLLIKNCYENHVKLDIESRSNKNMYYFKNLASENSEDRKMAYYYFNDVCTPDFEHAYYYMLKKWQKNEEMLVLEKKLLLKTIESQKKCLKK